MSDSTITFLVLAATVAVFMWDYLPVAVVAVGVPLSLWATDVLSLDDALSGFGDPTVIFIASLFVVSEALDASGVTAWVGGELTARAGSGRARLLTLTMLLVAVLTALISVNGAVAALLPVVVVMALRLKRSPSELLLPLAFAAHAGSLLLLTGTPVNVVVSDAAEEAGVGEIGFFEFGLVGLPLLAGTIGLVLLLGDRLVPRRSPRAALRDLGDHAATLARQYELDDGSDLFTKRSGVAEVVIPPRSSAIGDPVFPGMVTSSGDFVVLAIQRQGEELGPEEAKLEVGDTLLLRGTWDALDQGLEDDPSVLVVDAPERVRRQAVAFGARAWEAVVVLAAMVALLATGLVPPAVVGLLAACAMVVLKVVTIEQAYRGISWTTVILVGGMMALSAAMTQSGAANTLADGLVNVVDGAGPRALLLGLFVLTAVLSQLISNMATALIIIPVAISAAADMDVSAKPVLMAVAVSAAAAFLTPVATPANMMVMSPAGYRFGDYWKLGLPLLVFFGLVAVLLVPLIWSL